MEISKLPHSLQSLGNWPEAEEDVREVAGLIDRYLEDKYPELTGRQYEHRGAVICALIYASIRHRQIIGKSNGNEKAN